jgi:integrase
MPAKVLTIQSVERMKPDPARRLEIPDAALPGLYLVVQPSGVKSWAVRYRASGKPRKLTIGSYPAIGLGDAREEARKAIRKVGHGLDPAGEKKDAAETAKNEDPDKDLFATVVGRFLERHVRVKNKERSAEETERNLRLHVLPKWGDRKIQDITRTDVIDLLDEIADRGTPIAANRTLASIRTLFNWALDRSVIGSSPCVRVTPPAEEKSRDRVLSDQEIILLWSAADAIGWPFGHLTKLLLLTAQRRDEAAKITWSELAEGGTLWTIPKERTKNGEVHDVPLSASAQRVVSDAPKVAGKKGFIFTTTGDAAVSGYSKAKSRLDTGMLRIARKLAEEQGDDPDSVQIAPWRLHDLRRTAASGMARLGTPVHIIEAVLNHRNGHISGVAAIYNRYSYAAEKRRALDAWADHVMRLLPAQSEHSVGGKAA